MNITDLQTSDAPLSTLVATHDVYWCIEPSSGLSLWRQLQKETVSVHVAAFATAQAKESSKETKESRQPKPYRMSGSKAILTLSGTLMKAPSSFSDATSTVYFRRKLSQAANDPDVSEIVLAIDSPGGTAAGTNDAAEAVRAAAQKKPVLAYCEDMACSAAYWIASQASRIVANPTALVGSIGTLLVVYDYSRLAANEGIEPIVFSTSGIKGAGVPGTKVTEEQKAHFQRIVDDLNSHFLAAVQAGRRMSDAQLAAAATADVWVGQAAVTMGLVDEIASFDTVLAQGAPADYSAARGGQRREKTMFRAGIARALAAIGFSGIAGAMLANQSEEPGDIANDFAAQVEQEVKARVDAHPVLKALAEAGVSTEAQVQTTLQQAEDGRAAATEMQKVLQEAAVRRFGQGDWKQYAAAYQHLPLTEQRQVAAQWEKDADEKFGTSPTAPASRQTAPAALPVHAVDADTPDAESEARVQKMLAATPLGKQALKNGKGE